MSVMPTGQWMRGCRECVVHGSPVRVRFFYVVGGERVNGG
jgi:hypothetical protein